ncbi:hypothetical protein PCANC_03966 [Puccinia coronata f. sp. avenae]|uniref:Protein transport protein SFT2 n=1 Tax=Puccinia coronata f. sp. avenae TaxID=200324 RepID=A0A2N5T7V8_9BASI|nr:hypothetical protein PCANC_03966 [Puccinia coronata f. sp. avenae]PLW24346.1 hypothetical protein PCASD_06540 [Puccinia coronata f. sp. avenae]
MHPALKTWPCSQPSLDPLSHELQNDSDLARFLQQHTSKVYICIYVLDVLLDEPGTALTTTALLGRPTPAAANDPHLPLIPPVSPPAMSMPKVFANIDTGKVTNNELLDATQPSAFEFLGLSKKQRLYGFFGCLVGGFVISIIGSILFVFGSIVGFALLYTLGILISLTGTGFLIGFARQIKTMFKPVRVVATILFLGCVIMVFVAAFAINSDVLVLVFAILTFFSYTWYSLSYIPYARALVTKVVGSAV